MSNRHSITLLIERDRPIHKCYRRLGHLSIEEGLHRLKEVKEGKHGKQFVCGTYVYFSGLRLRTFLEKGTACVSCGIKGAYFAIERHSEYDWYHVNLYAQGKHGGSVLMTVDHIRPRALGGKDSLTNLQPMCLTCNMKKSDSYGIQPSTSEQRRREKERNLAIRKTKDAVCRRRLTILFQRLSKRWEYIPSLQLPSGKLQRFSEARCS